MGLVWFFPLKICFFSSSVSGFSPKFVDTGKSIAPEYNSISQTYCRIEVFCDFSLVLNELPTHRTNFYMFYFSSREFSPNLFFFKFSNLEFSLYLLPIL